MTCSLVLAPQPQATDLKAATALLQLAIQLHHQRATADVLDGRTLTLDDDGYLLTPNPVREPGPFAVSVEFPDGVEIGAVFDTLGFPFNHPGLEQAVMLVAKAKEDFEAVRAKAKGLIEDFVAEFAQAA
ncbi:hypothetical protein J2Z31_001734 [Sinorhizobium kostiense]|uniref:Uncharacterized protein n=1 Tax=Sinorhizobium kostiense TaxID=76747 RepID=A0ABS4QX67_9HYPH|nr:hypothetical protein [Sinorhizobium kostiense]MBP2235242.1 hypothetical protein [Sinorhizobium kostiense]